MLPMDHRRALVEPRPRFEDADGSIGQRPLEAAGFPDGIGTPHPETIVGQPVPQARIAGEYGDRMGIHLLAGPEIRCPAIELLPDLTFDTLSHPVAKEGAIGSVNRPEQAWHPDCGHETEQGAVPDRGNAVSGLNEPLDRLEEARRVDRRQDRCPRLLPPIGLHGKGKNGGLVIGGQISIPDRLAHGVPPHSSARMP